MSCGIEDCTCPAKYKVDEILYCGRHIPKRFKINENIIGVSTSVNKSETFAGGGASAQISSTSDSIRIDTVNIPTPILSNNTITYTCGIDIGTKNLSITFFNKNTQQIINYIGSPNCLSKFDSLTKEISVLHVKKNLNPSIAYMLRNITELAMTTRVVIEKQPGMCGGESTRMDGIIIGFMLGRNIEAYYCDPRKRKTFTQNKFNEEELSTIMNGKGSDYLKNKIISMKFFEKTFPELYNYLLQTSYNGGKIDDVCDSTIYALM